MGKRMDNENGMPGLGQPRDDDFEGLNLDDVDDEALFVANKTGSETTSSGTPGRKPLVKDGNKKTLSVQSYLTSPTFVT